jgi:hypothetical protein
MNRTTNMAASPTRLALRAAIALLTAGWLVPMWLGLATVLDFIELELWPLLLEQPKLNSFPFIRFAGQCFAAAFLWLGGVIAGWAWYVQGRKHPI